MKILAIETSADQGSVALLIDEEVQQRSLFGQQQHSAFVLPAVRELLAEAGIAMGALDAVACGLGPGAFTGVRLACSVAQGLACGAGLGVAALSSLEVLAAPAAGQRILALTDARMGEIYAAAYLREGSEADAELRLQGEVRCVLPQALEVPEDPAGLLGRWHARGSALRGYRERLQTQLGDAVLDWDADAWAEAAVLARLACRRVRAGSLLAPEAVQPLYVRNKVALTTAERLARGGKA